MPEIGNLISKQTIKRGLMIVPPILFLLYTGHSFMVIRELLSDSSSFHMDYANDLVQDYLEMHLEMDMANLSLCLERGQETCEEGEWLTLQGEGYPLTTITTKRTGTHHPIYLKKDDLGRIMSEFFQSQPGLNALFRSRHHQAPYWFEILDTEARPVYISGPKPEDTVPRKFYDLNRSLKGYQVEIVYNSFGPQQLYSVAGKRINFGLIFLLFILVIFSLILITRSIRQKIVLAKQKTFFVSTVSHEFKTPLAIMRLATETLTSKRFRGPEEERRFFGMIENEINRLGHLVHKILNFSKIEMGQIQFHNRELDLRDLVQASIDSYRLQARTDGVVIHAEMADTPCLIYGDGDLLRHVVDNILDNAVKYRGESNEIEVFCGFRDEDQVILSVRDHGIGITADELPHISKSFYRIDHPQTRGTRGSGLGLAISKYILKHSRAKLEVESRPGEGSCFTLVFPRYEGEQEEALPAGRKSDEKWLAE